MNTSDRKKEAAKLIRYINDSTFIEQAYQLPSASELLASEGVLGVARLIVTQAFCTESLHTFVYFPDRVAVSTTIGATSLWYSISQQAFPKEDTDLEEIETFDPRNACTRSTTLVLVGDGIPSILSSWSALLTATQAAPSCMTLGCDGVTYRHRVQDRALSINATWSNPDSRAHSAQIHLLRSYGQLLDSANLFPEEREAAEKKRIRNRENRLAKKQRKEERRKRE